MDLPDFENCKNAAFSGATWLEAQHGKAVFIPGDYPEVGDISGDICRLRKAGLKGGVLYQAVACWLLDFTECCTEDTMAVEGTAGEFLMWVVHGLDGDVDFFTEGDDG